MARDISNGTVDVKGNTASLVKGDKGTAKNGQVPSVRTRPIVMGRSVSAHHKTKLHHVRMKPLGFNRHPRFRRRFILNPLSRSTPDVTIGQLS